MRVLGFMCAAGRLWDRYCKENSGVFTMGRAMAALDDVSGARSIPERGKVSDRQ